MYKWTLWRRAGVEKNRIYSEFVSGQNVERQELKNCLKALEENEFCLFGKLDRLGRN
ncbi:MAG: recombinase family protein [Rickettsia sp.]|nr:recombinase family protein [Rickettsia sp.]